MKGKLQNQPYGCQSCAMPRPYEEEQETFARGGFETRPEGDALRRRCEGGLSIRRGEACLALFDRTAVVDAGRRMRRPYEEEETFARGGFETRPHDDACVAAAKGGSASVGASRGPQKRKRFWGAPHASPSSTGLLLLMQGDACVALWPQRRMSRQGEAMPRPYERLEHRLRAVEELGRIDWRRSLADLKVELGSIHVDRLTRVRDDLPTFDLVAALDQKLLGVSVSGDVTVRMPHQDEIAVALELVAGIRHRAVLGRLDRRVLRHRDIDSIILLPVGHRSERGDYAAICRPTELGERGGRVDRLARIASACDCARGREHTGARRCVRHLRQGGSGRGLGHGLVI